MKTKLPAVVMALLTSVVLHAQGVTAPPPPSPLTETQVLVDGQNVVIVSGTCLVALAPDVVSIDLVVSTSGPTVRKIVGEGLRRVYAFINGPVSICVGGMIQWTTEPIQKT